MGINNEIIPEITIKINTIATTLARVDPNYSLNERNLTIGLTISDSMDAINKYPTIIFNSNMIYPAIINEIK